MEQDFPQSPLGVYFHIPFCLSKCHYCSFYSVPFTQEKLKLYLELLTGEIDNYLEAYPWLKDADTLYFGGGTPSLLKGGQLKSLIERFSHAPEAEISLEVNPLQITGSFMSDLKDTGVNRLSLGLQSLNDAELIWLERRHKASQIPDKIRLLRDHGFENFSLDLIYGLPNATLQGLDDNLSRYIELKPKHISTYLLTLDDQEMIGDDERDELHARMYELIRDRLCSAGYGQYEISNFALPGYESRHNLHYWRSDDYLGLGASASGFIRGQRYQNPADMEGYESQVRGKTLIPDPEPETRLPDDFLMMGLRLLRGVSLAEYRARFGKDLILEKSREINKLTDMGLVQVDNEYISLSRKALFISNAVIGELIS
ncbi:MAG TPA: radical SAM family heme chaperone HemW [Candidatus Cloacimonadota bacterium]|nr:radical SAM family heme chaperone HemW [Candidatus Cloacimonadota bacterium]